MFGFGHEGGAFVTEAKLTSYLTAGLLESSIHFLLL